jgi:hydrogenase expression/formation protein HypC
MATVSVMGVERTCSLRLVPDAQVGDYVLVHAGFAIQRVEEQDAMETLKIFAQMPDLLGEELCAEINELEPGRVAEAARD